MEETKALAQHQLLLQHHHHHHQQQQQQQLQQVAHQTQQQKFMILQHLQQQQQQKQLAQASTISRFPSNIDAHLRALRPPINLQHNPNTSPNPNPNPTPDPSSNLKPNSVPNLHQQNARAGQQLAQQSPTQQQQQSQPQQKTMRPVNHLELQMAYQDAWRVCNPDFKRPFSSLEDACERLLPYHVVADYEAEEDERILDSDTTGQMPSRSQQWDHNIAAKVAEFTATFEKQALAFNIIYSKRVEGEFRSEERMMIEQALCQEAKRSYLEVKTELELRGRASLEAKIRMTGRAQAELTHAESQSHAERLVRGPIRANALGSQGNDISTGEQEHRVNPYGMMNGCGNNIPRDGREVSEDFLNDDENENADTRVQEGWRGVGEFDLNTR